MKLKSEKKLAYLNNARKDPLGKEDNSESSIKAILPMVHEGGIPGFESWTGGGT